MAQTAVEWLEHEINRRGPKENNPPQWLHELYQQAKQMEKEQRINAQMDMFNHINSMDYGLDYLNKRDAALKYAEDYSTRLQNETN